MSLWGILLVWITFAFFNKKHITILLLGFVILVLVLLPGLFKNEIINFFFDILQNKLSINKDNLENNLIFIDFFPFSIHISKIGHFIMFFVLTLGVAIVRKGLDVKILLLLFGFAAVTEILQIFSSSRRANIVDFYVDISGILFAASIILLGYLIFKTVKAK